MAILPLYLNHMHKFCSFLLHFLTPSPQWFYALFQPILRTIYIFMCTYLALWIFGEISLSKEHKASSLFESGFTITREWAFHNLWFNSNANKLASFLGTSWRSSLEEWEELHDFRKDIFEGKHKFLHSQEGCTLVLANPHPLQPVLHKLS